MCAGLFPEVPFFPVLSDAFLPFSCAFGGCAPGSAPHIYIYIYMRFQGVAGRVNIISKTLNKNTWPYGKIMVF